MAHPRALAIAEEARQKEMASMKAMIEEIHAAIVGKSSKASIKSTGKADEIGAVEPYEVDAEDLQESPVLEPVVPAKQDKPKK